MVLNEPFTTAPGAIASFSFEEIASGEKFVTFYPFLTNDNASGVEASLTTTPSTTYTMQVETTSSGITRNFDSPPFNFARTAKGTAFANIGVQGDGATFTVQLQKWNGSSATNITAAHAVGAGAPAKIVSFKMPVTTETLIPVGEQLRFVVAISVTTGTIGHSPNNRDGTILTPSSEDTITSTRINVPFRIDS